MVTFASFGPRTGLPWVVIFAAIALNGSAVTSSTSPKTTYLPSGDMMKSTSWVWPPRESFSVPSLAPGIFASVTPLTVASTSGGRFCLRR